MRCYERLRRRRDSKWVEVPLSRGYVALIDEADAPRVLAHKWQASLRRGGLCYARTKISAVVCECCRRAWQQTVYMHAFILGPPPEGHVIDHINRNGLDNRRENLRFATSSENARNRREAGQFRGVAFDPERGLWCADLDGRSLGAFATAEEAARAHDAAALKRYGRGAALNYREP